MAEIVQDGDKVLRKIAQHVPAKDIGSSRLNRIIAEMKEALAKEEHGVAIAAPQIGISMRIFVVSKKVFGESQVRVEEHTEMPQDDLVFINPDFVRKSKRTHKTSEGCLSVRGIFGTTVRHDKTSIRASDEKGGRFVWNGSGLMAQIFQHEMDHLEGILFTDHATELTGDANA